MKLQSSRLECVRKFTIDSVRQPQIFLVANKSDLEHLRTINMDEQLQLARKYQLSSVLVSAKTGDSVDLCFQKIVADILGLKMTQNEMEQQIGIIKAQIPTAGGVNCPRSQMQVSSATGVKMTPNNAPAIPVKNPNSNVCCIQ
uniref:Uncharacterized protein n=1 Tax=Romanomermis culicivorax TaxID=13658 RepID=A0A915II72_ROMCU